MWKECVKIPKSAPGLHSVKASLSIQKISRDAAEHKGRSSKGKLVQKGNFSYVSGHITGQVSQTEQQTRALPFQHNEGKGRKRKCKGCVNHDQTEKIKENVS